MEAATTETREAPTRTYREALTLYHAAANGNGAALRIDPCIHRGNGDRSNCFFLELARQKSAASPAEDGGRKRASFDWENKITVKLGFADLCEFLAVFEGTRERAGGSRDGLYHRSGNHTTLIRLSRRDKGGLAVSLSRKNGDDAEPVRIGTVISETEAVGIRHILGMGLYFMVAPPPVA